MLVHETLMNCRLQICHKLLFQRKSCPLIDPANVPRTSGMDQCCACWRMWDDGTWDAALCHLRALSSRPFLLIVACQSVRQEQLNSKTQNERSRRNVPSKKTYETQKSRGQDRGFWFLAREKCRGILENNF